MYQSQAKTTKITAVSRCSVKIKENFYTIECQEERSIPIECKNVDVEEEWNILFNDLNVIVDNQISEIVKSFQK